MYLGVRVMNQLDKSRISATDPNLLDFQQRCQNFLIIACEEIKKRYDFNNPVLTRFNQSTFTKGKRHYTITFAISIVVT